MAGKSMMQFLYEVKAEMAKVVWPKFGSWMESTIVVLVLVIAFAIYLFVIDTGLVRLVEYIIKNYGQA